MHSQQTHSLALPILLISSFGISLVRVEATQKNFCGTYLLTYCRNCNVCSRGKGGCLFHLIDDNDSASHLSRTDLRGFIASTIARFCVFLWRLLVTVSKNVQETASDSSACPFWTFPHPLTNTESLIETVGSC